MEPSSRTPEGEPNRCPICDGAVRLEPSQPAGHALCPHCGCLISYERAGAERIDSLEQASGGRIDRSPVEQTKRAIQEWVSHIKALSRSQVPAAEYFRELVDGLVATLAARGGALWLPARRRWTVEYHVGLESVGISEKGLRKPPHIRLVDRVLATGARCAVPPGSWSRLARRGTCPTDSLVLLCPVTHASQTRAVVEIFQRTEAGPATQRAYLRYLQQICSVAGESPVFCSLAPSAAATAGRLNQDDMPADEKTNPYASPRWAPVGSSPRTRWRIIPVTLMLIGAGVGLLASPVPLIVAHDLPVELGGGITWGRLLGTSLALANAILWIAAGISCWRGKWRWMCVSLALALAAWTGAQYLLADLEL